MSKKRALGRGVGALLGVDFENEEDGKFFQCEIDKIIPNPNQPRQFFDETKLENLAESIKEHGVIQPLLVTRGNDHNFNLIAGERRLRAARMAGMEEVPVVVMDSEANNENLELALIENIQRHDLNPIEEATAYSRLIEEFDLTQDEVARKVGRNRSTITNILRLLQLPLSIQTDVASSKISEGHARVLLRFKDEPDLIQEVRDRIVTGDLSVRETERICKKKKDVSVKKKTENKTQDDGLPTDYCMALANQLINHLNTKVRIIQNGQRGKVEIEYFSSDDLDRLIEILVS